MNNTSYDSVVYNYKISSKIKIIIGLAIFLLGILFCLSFFARSNLPNMHFFGDNYSQKNTMISFVMFPVCLISFIAGLFYLYQYFSKVEVTEKHIIKRRPLSSQIKIKRDSISKIKVFRLILTCIILDNDGRFIILFPSIKNYEKLVKSIYQV